MSHSLINKLAARPLPWMYDNGADDMIAVSSRVRLARNVSNLPFPNRAKDALRQEFWSTVLRKIPTLTGNDDWKAVAVNEVETVDRLVLLERSLISRELLSGGAGSGVVFHADEGSGILVNEEDHFRIQALEPGLQLERAWEAAAVLEFRIAAGFDFAFDPALGFLTSCPTNVGTGLRASVMLHLPGLVFCDTIGEVINAIDKMGLIVRGIFGEGTEAVGSLFQLSNQSTLGESEVEILERLERIVEKIIWHEKNARLRLLRRDRERLYDHAGRGYGLLREARILGSEEALSCLSALWLGIEMGLFQTVSRKDVHEWLLTVQPGHLQKRTGETLDADARDRVRATLMRERMRSTRAG